MNLALMLVVGLICLIGATVVGGRILAHEQGPGSWMNQERLLDPESNAWCCNEQDCHQLVEADIVPVPGGYRVVETGEIIPKARVIWRSPDGHWWRCAYEAGDRKGMTRCLIGPLGPNT